MKSGRRRSGITRVFIVAWSVIGSYGGRSIRVNEVEDSCSRGWFSCGCSAFQPVGRFSLSGR